MRAVEESGVFMIDEDYEFSAPRFYDFIDGETEEDMRKAELWFEINSSYAPSPVMPRIKTGRTVEVQTLCDFSEAEKSQKATGSSSSVNTSDIAKESVLEPEKQERPQAALMPSVTKEGMISNNESKEEVNLSLQVSNEKASNVEGTEVCTPAPPTIARKGDSKTDSKKRQDARKIASLLKNPSALKSKGKLQESQAKNSKLASVRRDTNGKNTAGTLNLAQENQAIKRQKLDGGKARPILSIKPPNLPHKTKGGFASSSSSIISNSTVKTRKEERKIYVREPAAQFVSTAEMIKKFQSSTRDLSMPSRALSLSHDGAAGTLQKPKLSLTRPKEPEFETAQRARPLKAKSSAELEEEMMAKMPKFKARPLNKKILEAPTLPALPRSTPQLPAFKEFHLETTSRAHQNAETSTVASTESTQNHHEWKPHHLTAPKSPVLQTSLRARPPTVKSSQELEKEELEKIPKFKARPLNKKIFESKGELGLFCNTKRQITVPQEFHFALDERIPPPPANVADLFDKLSLNSESHYDKHIPRNTNPDPFHLHTEERGVEKERRLAMELMQKQMEEERARVPKANPYPYTTDYPVIPPKPESKPCTKPEPFPLESLARHEEELQREMEERRRMEMEEARMRVFKAQPILKQDPIPLPEKVRKPLTQVQEFDLHVEHRAVDRAEFDKKIKEKQMMYKRYREEADAARMMEEEKAMKQLRRTLVPHARPVPKFDNPFLPQRSSKEVTKPKSPKLHVLRRKERRNMISPMAASHMR